MMDNQPDKENIFKNIKLNFKPIGNSLAMKSLMKDFKGVVKESVIQNLPLIMNEFMKELLKKNLAKSEKNNENQQIK